MSGMEFKIIRAQPQHWQTFAELRLHYLRAEPAAYGSEFAREVGYGAELWQERLAANWSFLAYPADAPNGAPIGTATGLWLGDGDTLVVAMYVAPGLAGPAALTDSSTGSPSRPGTGADDVCCSTSPTWDPRRAGATPGTGSPRPAAGTRWIATPA